MYLACPELSRGRSLVLKSPCVRKLVGISKRLVPTKPREGEGCRDTKVFLKFQPGVLPLLPKFGVGTLVSSRGTGDMLGEAMWSPELETGLGLCAWFCL